MECDNSQVAKAVENSSNVEDAAPLVLEAEIDEALEAYKMKCNSGIVTKY